MVTCFDPMEIPNGDGDISVSRKKRNLDGLVSNICYYHDIYDCLGTYLNC